MNPLIMTVPYPLIVRTIGLCANAHQGKAIKLEEAEHKLFVIKDGAKIPRRGLTYFHIMIYHPGRWEEAKLVDERSFSQRIRKANSYYSPADR